MDDDQTAYTFSIRFSDRHDSLPMEQLIGNVNTASQDPIDLIIENKTFFYENYAEDKVWSMIDSASNLIRSMITIASLIMVLVEHILLQHHMQNY